MSAKLRPKCPTCGFRPPGRPKESGKNKRNAEIKALGATMKLRELAKRYRLSKSRVHAIIHGL